MGVTKEGVESTLTTKLQPTHLEVVDTSGGCGASFAVSIVSEAFEGKRLLERHRLVNTALSEEMKDIHALSISKALTPKQWSDQQPPKAAAPEPAAAPVPEQPAAAVVNSLTAMDDEVKGPCKSICALTTLPPDLKHIKPEDRKSYRQTQIQQWLENMVVRAPRECFGHYIGRVYTMMSRDLSFDASARYCMGNEYPHFLDRYVWRILQGARLGMIKHGVVIGADQEAQYLALLREEVEELFNDDQILPDPRLKMEPGDTWVHEKEHCASSRAARACEKDGEHTSGFHEAKCDGAAGKNFKSF